MSYPDDGLKQVIDENQEMDSLDSLEKDFQRVIADMVNDHSLDNFREEYQKIHDSFLRSHANNIELVKKCRDLNSEILSNSTKVNSILQLSQDDQRTISGLRFEFDKAWKMVELSQDRENKSHDVIENLKIEVNRLTKLVESGGVMQFAQDTSLETLQTEIEMLTHEIEVQKIQCDSLQEDLQKSNDDQVQSLKTIEDLKEESSSVQEELEATKKGFIELQQEIGNLNQQIASLKMERKESLNSSDNMVIKIEEQRKHNKNLGDQLIEHNRETRSSTDEKQKALDSLNLTKGLLEKQKKTTSHITDSINEISKELSEKDQKMQDLSKVLESLKTETEQGQIDFSAEKVKKAETAHELSSIHERLNALRTEVYKRTHEVIRSESKIKGMKKQIVSVQDGTIQIKNAIGDAKINANQIEDVQNGIYAEMMALKAEIYKIQSEMENLNIEIDNYGNIASSNRSNMIVIDSDRKSREDQISELEKAIIKTKEKIQRQQTLTESVLQQRDIVRRQLESLLKETAKVEDQNTLLAEEVKQTKELIREKDEKCVQTHLNKELLSEQVQNLCFERDKIEQKLKDTTVEVCTIENTLMRTRYLLDVAEHDVSRLKLSNERLESDSRSLEWVVQKRDMEAIALKEKIVLLKGKISSMSNTYAKTVDNVEKQKAELEKEVEIMKKKKALSCHYAALKLEQLRTEKALLTEQGKVKALEEEFEQPIGIHRWRFLESTNPEQMQMIRMTQALRGALMTKLAAIDRLNNIVKRLQEKSEKVQKHVYKTSVEEHQETIHFFEDLLREKTRQLQLISSQIGGQQPFVEESKENVDAMRLQLRDTKKEYYTIKKAEEKIRASSSIGNDSKSSKSPISQSMTTTTRLTGGGFGISNGPRTGSLSGLSGQTKVPIIVPQPIRSKKMNSMKMVPKQWNQNRDPLNPYLPTVS